MSKLSYEQRISIYNERKQGISISTLSKKYNVRENVIQYMVCLIDKHGIDILRKDKNMFYPKYKKEEIINRVLIGGEPVWAVAIDEGIQNDGTLRNWIKKYKEMGYNIVERKRGRPTMDKKNKPINKEETQEEKIKRLEKENLYLKAELEYSKKLRAVVQARKNQQQKKKQML